MFLLHVSVITIILADQALVHPRIICVSFFKFHRHRPDSLDSALRRPGRLDRELEIRAPTVSERRDVLDKLLSKVPHVLTDDDVRQLAAVTHGFVGADLSLLCAEASLASAKRLISSSVSGGLLV